MTDAIGQDAQWQAARLRMLPYLKAVFWQDFAIPDVEHAIAVDWILDRIFLPEFRAAARGSLWRLLREDDNSNVFVVVEVADQAEAERLRAEYVAKGHKQRYWIEEHPVR